MESQTTRCFSYFCLLGPPISLHIFCLKTSSGLQNCICVRQYVFFFVRCRFMCLAYLGGLSFDFCECSTLFNDEASDFLIFAPKKPHLCVAFVNSRGSAAPTPPTSGMRCNAEAVFQSGSMQFRIFRQKTANLCELSLL